MLNHLFNLSLKKKSLDLPMCCKTKNAHSPFFFGEERMMHIFDHYRFFFKKTFHQRLQMNIVFLGLSIIHQQRLPLSDGYHALR